MRPATFWLPNYSMSPHAFGLSTRTLHLRSKKSKLQLIYILSPTLTMAREDPTYLRGPFRLLNDHGQRHIDAP